MKIEKKSVRAEIIFFDDDEECLKRTSRLLRKLINCEVSEFHVTENFSHDKFIEHFCEKDFDLTILDLNMPANWHEIFKSIREKDPEHPIVIFTAFKEDFKDEMVELHVTEAEDPLIKIIPKGGLTKTKDALIPSIEHYAKISMIRKLNKQISFMVENCNDAILNEAMISLAQVSDKIYNYAIALKEASGNKHAIDLLVDDLKEYLNSKSVWDYFYKKGSKKSSLLLLLKKFLTSVSSSDLTNDDLTQLCNTLSLLNSDSEHETLYNAYNSLMRLMRIRGVSIVPTIVNINSLLKSYEDELWEVA